MRGYVTKAFKLELDANDHVVLFLGNNHPVREAPPEHLWRLGGFGDVGAQIQAEQLAAAEGPKPRVLNVSDKITANNCLAFVDYDPWIYEHLYVHIRLLCTFVCEKYKLPLNVN